MHILFDAHPITNQPTGIGRYCFNLIKNLQKTLPKDSKISLYQHKGQEHIFPNLNKFVFPIKNGLARSMIGFDLAIEKLKPDLIHSTTLSPLLKTIPQVITVHDICFHTHPEKYSLKTRLAFKLLFNRSIVQADIIICPSKTVKKSLTKYFKVSPNKIHVTYEAPQKIFQQKQSKIQIQKTLNKYKIHKPFFLVVGDMHQRKNSSSIIQTFQKFNSTHPNTTLIFVGPSQQKPQNNNIIYTGYISDQKLSHLYQSTQALIFNSTCEGFGLPIIEAMSGGCPIICSDIPVFQELYKNSCIYFNNSHDLTSHIIAMLTNKKLHQKYSKLSLKHAQNFSWKIIAQQTLKTYLQLNFNH